MFDVGFIELVIIALVALLVLGPEKLLHMAKVVGRMVGKLRYQFMTVKEEINREIRVDEMRRHLAKEEQALRASMQEQTNTIASSLSVAIPASTPSLASVPATTDLESKSPSVAGEQPSIVVSDKASP